ncbi:unnamed protein product [Darwinula stevensoni]|uniref:EGF-like domain-containing protein n=1 Tax=Darwinula stevensoni TaxID=69355 RepID=A0A7R9AER4_9CRUS|nr:unnamed protein product [Darwinula stevensoni]CAG0902249.1 unnamed protein product [Darwinula stevensoni]
MGERCDVACEWMRFGPNCSKPCDCDPEFAGRCDAVTGSCICKPGAHGTGRCVCEKGWTGTNCDQICPDGTYGEECKGNCPSCVHGRCHHTTGECVCNPGYTGKVCDDVCSKHRFGNRCQEICTCKNDGECHHITVVQEKFHLSERQRNSQENALAWMAGEERSARSLARKELPASIVVRIAAAEGACPEGFFGEQCKNMCECSEGNFQCHHIDGCTCKPGFQGDNCKVPTPHSKQQSDRSWIIGGLIGGTVLIILFILGLAGFLIRLRRKALIRRKMSRQSYIRTAPRPEQFKNPFVPHAKNIIREGKRLTSCTPVTYLM